MCKIHKQNQCKDGNDTYFVDHVIIIPRDNNLNFRSEDVENSEQAFVEIANQKAEILLETARKEAEEILKQANRKAELAAEVIKKNAFESGYQLGHEQGLHALEDITDQAKKVLQEMLDEKYRLISELEPQIIQLSIKIAEKILKQDIQIDQSKFLLMIANAMKKVAGTEQVRLYVNSEQYNTVHELRHLLHSEAQKIKNIDIFKDELIEEWGCVIETDCGVIDAGIHSQIKNIEEVFQLRESRVS